MDISKLSKRYHVIPITDDKITAVVELCLENPLYYKYCPPKPSFKTVKEDLMKLPPRKNMEDKFYVGFYDGNTLVAVMDLILGYPNPSTIFIGFFMMKKKFQGKGIGSSIVNDVFEYLSLEYFYVRLGVVFGNEMSERFWLKNSFLPTGVVIQEKNYKIVVLERKLVL